MLRFATKDIPGLADLLTEVGDYLRVWGDPQEELPRTSFDEVFKDILLESYADYDG